MTDIHDIERIVYFMPYLKPETWYVIVSCVSIYVIHIFYLFLAERHRKYHEKMAALSGYTDPYEAADRGLATLDSSDGEFFTRLHLLVRTYLENTGQVENAIKKTTEEILIAMPSEKLRTLLEICARQEYAPSDSHDRAVAEQMHLLAREIIDGIERTGNY